MEIMNEVEKLGTLILDFMYKIMVIVSRWFFIFYYRNDRKHIPEVKEPLLKESATSLARKIRTKEIKSEDLLKLFIRRIKDVNPIVNCVTENRFEVAMIEARLADELIQSGQMTEEQLIKEKPFLGVPFTVKNCIAVKDLHHTSGSVRRRNIIAEEDGLCVKYLRNAGAIPIGLTNVSELCMWWESENNLHGRTCNPYDTRRIAGGSSGGEGCVQTICGSAFGIGTDIGGSIRIPAFFNGIFGHKPSKFTVSNDGQFPPPPEPTEKQASFLATGPLCKRAEDLKPLLKVLAGENATKLKLDEPVDIKKLKVYYQYDNLNSPVICNVEPAVRKTISTAVTHLNKICKVPAKELKIEKVRHAMDIFFSNVKCDDPIKYDELLTGKKGQLNIVYEIFKYFFGKSDCTFVCLFAALFMDVGINVNSPKHKTMLRYRDELEEEFIEFLKDDGVFLYPTHPTAAPYHNETMVRFYNASYTALINMLGFPVVHIPMGLDEEGLPIGFQVVANHNNDRLCLAVAEEMEKAFGGWIDPGTNKKQL